MLGLGSSRARERLARRLQQNANRMRAKTRHPPATPPAMAGIDLFEPPELCCPTIAVTVGALWELEVLAAPRSVTEEAEGVLVGVVEGCVDVLVGDATGEVLGQLGAGTSVRGLVANSAGMRSSRGQDPCWHGLIVQHPWKEGVVSRHVYQSLPEGQVT